MFGKKKPKIELKFPETDLPKQESGLKNFNSEQIIPESERLNYFSIRILVSNDEHTTNPLSKEIWRCKDKDEAEYVLNFLNNCDYYWVPVSSKGRLFVREEIL